MTDPLVWLHDECHGITVGVHFVDPGSAVRHSGVPTIYSTALPSRLVGLRPVGLGYCSVVHDGECVASGATLTV
jgi:hypothetical protein